MKLELLNIFGQSFKGGDIKFFPKDKTVFFFFWKIFDFFRNFIEKDENI